jgi:tRNA G46 methylase TrmB
MGPWIRTECTCRCVGGWANCFAAIWHQKVLLKQEGFKIYQYLHWFLVVEDHFPDFTIQFSIVGSGRYVSDGERTRSTNDMEASIPSPDSTAIELERRHLDGLTTSELPPLPQQQQQRLLPTIHQEYTSRKPTWWKQRAGKATKGQRRVMALLQEQYSLRKPLYGEFLSWDAIFPTASGSDQQQQHREIWLEIGFGLGDNLLCLAARSSPRCFQLSTPFSSTVPAELLLKEKCNGTTTTAVSKSRCYVGAEIHASGLGTLYTRIESAQQAGCHWNGYTVWSNNTVDEDTMDSANGKRDCCSTNGETASSPDFASDSIDKGSRLYHNLRIFAGDGTKLLPCIPDSSVAAVIIAFPDPFAATHEEHWRLLQLSVLHELRRILHGRLYLATDHEAYYAWSHVQVARFNVLQEAASRPGFTLVEPTPHRSTWLPVVSKYEQKGYDEGRSTHLSCWV